MVTNTKDQRGITTVELTDGLQNKITKFNDTHPNSRINKSAVCREALERELEWRLLKDKADKANNGAKRT